MSRDKYFTTLECDSKWLVLVWLWLVWYGRGSGAGMVVVLVWS